MQYYLAATAALLLVTTVLYNYTKKIKKFAGQNTKNKISRTKIMPKYKK